jgi:hypothetical protein
VYALEKPIEKSDDLVALADITISLGKSKGLVILGTRLNKLEHRKDYTIKHQDVEILGLHITEKATGDFVQQAFEETRNRIGFDFLSIITDQGAEMKKGCKQYLKDHPGVVIHDIKHKMSLVMEHALKKDKAWIEYNVKMLETRRLIQQTELAAAVPPRQRNKARFMDVGYILDWPKRILKAKQSGHLNKISNERYIKYFGWFKDYKKAFEDWNILENAVDMINRICREYGLSNETYEYLKINIKKAFPNTNEYLKKFLEEALKFVEEESSKLKPGQVMLCSTEVVESIFGKFKELNSGNQGIGANILGLATFVGPKMTETSIKKAMESCSTKKGLMWIKQKIGETIGSLRRQFFYGTKKDKICHYIN